MLRNLLKGDYRSNEKYTPEEKIYDEKTFNKLKNIYNTCLDVDAINKKGSQPMIDLLNELKIYENRKRYATVEGLTDLIFRLHNRSVPFLFDISNIYLSSYSDKYVFVVVENSSYLAGNKASFYTKYKQYVHDTLELIFQGKENRNIDAMTNAVVDFEYQLHQAAMGKIKKGDNDYEYSIRKLSEQYPFIDWKMYFGRMMKYHNIDSTFTEDSPILNYSTDYFAALDDVMWKFSIEQLAYFAEWSVIKSFINYLSDDIRKPDIDFKISINDEVETELSREDFCDEKINEMMGMALGKYFVDLTFTDKAETDASNTITYVKEAMVNRIPQMSWLDEKTKEHAIEKVFKMVDRIGYPEYIMNPEKLSEDYKDFDTCSDDYFTNMINYDYYSFAKNIKLYNKVFENEKWLMTPQTINAYYNIADNSINFPAGIFQSPFYHTIDPDYINYGGIGVVVSHELIHGFDDNGRKFDANGKRRNWWTDEDSEKFNELTQCFINQYSNFTITGSDGTEHSCSGKKTLGENLADNGGIARSYEAWILSIEETKTKNPQLVKERNPLLPGLSHYSYEQLFYIAYGQTWCTNATPEKLLNQIRTDEHSPAKFRVNGVVMNSDHFSKVFNCPIDSPMNPKEKCLIW
eukprot:jgi/Orpsp1_1/1183562/evm.model.c7180000085730.1